MEPCLVKGSKLELNAVASIQECVNSKNVYEGTLEHFFVGAGGIRRFFTDCSDCLVV